MVVEIKTLPLSCSETGPLLARRGFDTSISAQTGTLSEHFSRFRFRFFIQQVLQQGECLEKR